MTTSESQQNSRRMSILAAIILAAAALLIPVEVLASGPTVVIVKNYQPSPITIVAGQTITWVNRDNVAHFLASDLNQFAQSGRIDPGGTYTVRFTKIGTYNYHDAFYDSMTGTVIVKAAPPATPKPTTRSTPRPTVRPVATPKPTIRPAPATSRPTQATASAGPSPTASQGPASAGSTAGPDSGPATPDAGGTVRSSASALPDVTIIAVVLVLLVLAFVAGSAVQNRRRDRPE